MCSQIASHWSSGHNFNSTVGVPVTATAACLLRQQTHRLQCDLHLGDAQRPASSGWESTDCVLSWVVLSMAMLLTAGFLLSL